MAKRKSSRKRRKPRPGQYKLKTGGVADKEKWLRGCMAFIGLLFLLLFVAWVASFFTGGGS